MGSGLESSEMKVPLFGLCSRTTDPVPYHEAGRLLPACICHMTGAAWSVPLFHALCQRFQIRILAVFCWSEWDSSSRISMKMAIGAWVVAVTCANALVTRSSAAFLLMCPM